MQPARDHNVAAKIGADGATALEGESSPCLMGSHRYELVSQGPRVGGMRCPLILGAMLCCSRTLWAGA